MYSYPLPYLHYLVHFHIDQDYFECHEILEEFWKEKTEQERDSVWVGLIQTAVAFYHHRRGNIRGAEKILKKAIQIFEKRLVELEELGIDTTIWLHSLHNRLEDIKQGKPFSPTNIPFSTEKVTQQYHSFCQACLPDLVKQTNNQDPSIIHKHKMRDRTDVITERQKALTLRHTAH